MATTANTNHTAQVSTIRFALFCLAFAAGQRHKHETSPTQSIRNNHWISSLVDACVTQNMQVEDGSRTGASTAAASGHACVFCLAAAVLERRPGCERPTTLHPLEGAGRSVHGGLNRCPLEMESGSQAMTTEAGLVFSTAETWNATFENNSTEEMNSFYFYQTEQVTVLWILFVLIVLGNSAVLAALLLDSKGRKSRMNFFIMHLAFADLSVGLISVLTDIVWRITVTWHAGHVACKLIRFSQGMVTYSSTYVLVVLSIDRYDAITHPMNFSGSWRRSRILVAVAWLLSAVFSIPLLILYEEKEIQGKLQCWIELDQWQWQVYMVLVSVSLFFIPALIITFCYAVIVITIWSKSKMLTGKKKRCHRNGSHRNSSSRSREDADSRRASSRGIIPRAKIKTVKMTFIIVFVFVLCWSPYMVFDLLQVFGHVPNTQTNIAVATFIQSLAPLNSAANPLIYCFFSTPICRTLRRVPPLSWLSICFPDMQRRRQEANSRCLRYGGTNSTTMTETMTHLSTRRNVRLAANQQSSNYCRQPPPRVAVTLV